MRKRIRFRAVLGRPRRAFWLIRIFQRDVVNLMPLMQIAQHFQRADLSTFGGGMHEVGVNPQDLHAGTAACSDRTSIHGGIAGEAARSRR
jgi:hypothetical protein